MTTMSGNFESGMITISDKTLSTKYLTRCIHMDKLETTSALVRTTSCQLIYGSCNYIYEQT